MKNVFVSYEVALELKQLGFDEPCIAFYNGRFLDFKIWNDDGREASQINVNMDVGQCPNAPTFSQVFRWFREKYKLPSWVYTSDNEKFYYGILRDTRFLIDGNKPYETYEEAEWACLLKLIEVVILAQKK